MLKRIRRFLLIRDDESATVGYFLLFFFLLGAGLAIGRSTTDALFFKRYGIQYLPVMYVLLAGCMMVVTLTYAAFADRLPAERVFRVFFGALLALLLANWALIAFTTLELAYPAYFLLYELASDLLVVHFSLYLTQNLETLQSKRLVPVIFAGAQVGTIAGGLFLAFAVKPLGVPSMMLVWSLLLVAALALMVRRHRRYGVSPHFRRPRRGRGSVHQAFDQIAQGLRFARRSELVLMSSVALFFTVIAFFILCYTVSRIYAMAFTSEESLTAFFGTLAATTSTIAIVIQAFVTNRMLRRYGVRRVNLFFPVTTLVSYVLLLAHFALPAAIFASINKDAFMKAFRQPVRNLIFNALPTYMQGRTRALAVGLVLPAALSVAGGILWLAQRYQTPTYFLLAGVVTAALYFYFNLRTNRAYVGSLVSMLRERLFVPPQGTDLALHGGGDAVCAELVRGVGQSDAAIVTASAERLVALFPRAAVEPLLARLASVDVPTHDRLIRLLAPLDPPQFRDYLWRALDGADAHLRASALQMLFDLRDERARERVGELLDSANPRLRAAGIAGVRSYDIAALAARAATAWDALLEAPAADAVLAGLELLAKQPELRHRERLLQLLRHTDPRVRHAALTALARWPEPRLPALADSLELLIQDPEVEIRCAAVLAAGRLEPGARIEFARRALDDEHPDVRAAAVVCTGTGATAMVQLDEWARDRQATIRARETALHALLREHPPRELLVQLALQVAQEARYLAQAHRAVRVDVGGGGGVSLKLIGFTLEERIPQLIDLSLAAIEHVEDPSIIATIRAGLRCGDRRHVAGACETLRNLGNRDLATILGDLLEHTDTPTGAVPFGSAREALDWLHANADPWLRLCAQRALQPVASPSD